MPQFKFCTQNDETIHQAHENDLQFRDNSKFDDQIIF